MYTQEEVHKAVILAGFNNADAEYVCSLLNDARDIPVKYIPPDLNSFFNNFCTTLNISPELLQSKKRDRILADLRAVFCILASEVFPLVIQEEIVSFIKRDRTTFVYYLRENDKCKEKYKLYREVRRKMNL